MSAQWSWVFVAWLVPSGPVAFTAWWLVSALKFERQRRAIVMPPPGYRLVDGWICRDRNRKKPAVWATFELAATLTKGVTLYRPRAHTFAARPFTIKTQGGERLEVRATRDAVALHAPVEGTDCSRFSQVVAGHRVWVYGHTDVVARNTRGHETVQHVRETDGKPSLLVSTEPIAMVFRSERNRRLWLASAATTFLLVVELTAFGGYWDVVRAGRPTVGHVVDKWVRFGTSNGRSGLPYKTTTHVIAVEADGHRKDLEVTEKSWEQVGEQASVAVLLSPTTIILGPHPHTTSMRCAMVAMLVFLGLLGLAFAGSVQRPWYSTKRGWRGTDSSPSTRT